MGDDKPRCLRVDVPTGKRLHPHFALLKAAAYVDNDRVIEAEIPGRAKFFLSHLVLDVNGTIACDGRILEGVEERFEILRQRITLHLVTADTHHRQAEIDRQLGLRAHRIGPAGQARGKLEYITALGPESVVAIGNGANDAEMLERAALGILVIGFEGASVEALLRSKIVVTDILAALDLLIAPARLTATLRI